MMIKRFTNFFEFMLVLVPWFACSQSAAPRPEFDLEEYFSDTCFQTAAISILAYDLEGDSTFASFHPELALPPASTQKILTTAASLLVLGPDFQYQTKVFISGRISNDTLIGDLIIKGTGDPSLGSSHFTSDGFASVLDPIIRMVTEAGIRHITGNVVGNAGYYSLSTIPRSWPFLHLGNYYGAFCAGLNFFDNQYYLRFAQRPLPGDAVTDLTTEPEVPGLQLQSYVQTGAVGSGDEAYIMGAPFQNNRYVTGTIPPGQSRFTIKGSVPDPALFLAFHLKNHLTSRGIEIEGAYRSDYSGQLNQDQLLGTLSSPNLSDIVNVTNQKSINLFAEGLGLRSADSLPLSADDWLYEFWKQKGVDMTGCHFYDYSGLAQDNALTAKTMVDILKYIYRQKDLWPVFVKSLAIAGEKGTLASMFKKSPARGRIIAKSGLINGVRSYAGYMQSQSDKWYAFDVMTYNPSCDSQQVRKKLAHLLETMYLSLR